MVNPSNQETHAHYQAMSNIQQFQDSLKDASLDELLAIIAAATAEAKKKAKIVVKAPKEAKEKKGSMPKGELPPQLQKPFAWVDYTLKQANESGWTSYKVKGQEEMAEASELRDGVHVFPSTGKPLNRKQAMSLSKYYWSAKEKKGENQALYEAFDAQHVPSPRKVVVEESDDEAVSACSSAEAMAPKPKKEKAAPKPKKTEAEKEAEKEAKLAAKEAEKEAKKAEKKTAKKAAPKAEAAVSPMAASSPAVAASPVAAVEEVGLEAPKKKSNKPATEAVVDTWVPKTTDGKVYPRTIGGVDYFSDHLHQIWTKEENGGVGDWAGIFLVSENRIDATVADPCDEE